MSLKLKTDDFFPYADGPTTYWTGYFTSRPASKRFERTGNNLLQVAKQLMTHGQESYENAQINSLKEAVGIMQHHDAITGTEKQHVTDNYHFMLSNGLKNANNAAGTVLAKLISGGPTDFEFDACLLANVSACTPSESQEFTVVLYNPLSKAQSSVVNLPIFTDLVQWEILSPEGEQVEYEIDVSLKDFSFVADTNTAKSTIVFVAKNIPALGFKVYRLKATDEKYQKTEQKTPARFVGYENTGFEISEETGLLSSITMNGITLDISQDFLYYESANSSGAYIFVPRSNATTRIASGPITTTLVNGDVSQGVLQEFGSWAQQFIKVYKDDPSYIEFDWIVGPLDISNNIGKEVITKFTTSLQNNGVFYTDSNGREMIERKTNFRPDYTYSDEEPIAGNYYPINTKILIKDETQQIEFAVLTDRSQGGSSINDGEIEIMVHRACQRDDGRGVGENLNEQQYSQGIEVRGKHYVVIGSTKTVEDKSLAAIERDMAQKKVLAPWAFISSKDISNELNTLTFSGLAKELPENVHILTLEPWKENVILIRFEHILEKDEDEILSQEVEINLEGLFTQFSITSLQETALAGNIPLNKKNRLHWPGSANEEQELPNTVSNLTITLVPMQIRTFLADVEYH